MRQHWRIRLADKRSPGHRLDAALREADVVISATRAPQFVIHAAELGEQHPRLLIDISLPRTIDPTAADLPGVEYYTLDSLQALIDTHLAQRHAALPQVEALIEQEAALFLDWLHSREVAPLISDLQRWARASPKRKSSRRSIVLTHPTRRPSR